MKKNDFLYCTFKNYLTKGAFNIFFKIVLLFILSIGTQIYIINKLKNVNNDLEIQILNNKILSNLYSLL